MLRASRTVGSLDRHCTVHCTRKDHETDATTNSWLSNIGQMLFVLWPSTFRQKFYNIFMPTIRLSLSLSCESALLNLGQSPASADNHDRAQYSSHRQHLEQVPVGVVQEEDTLHGCDTAQEQSMRYWISAHGFAEVVDVGSKGHPDTAQDWQSERNDKGEEARDDARWVLGVGLEDVADFWLLAVAERWLRRDDWGGWVADEVQGEGLAVVWGGRAEGADDEVC